MEIAFKGPDSLADDVPMQSFTTRTILLAVALLGVLTLTACSDDSYSSEIALEAEWQCDVQRHTFEQLGDIATAFESRLVTSGISAEQYAAFKAALEESPQLRTEVLGVYDQYCGVTVD